MSVVSNSRSGVLEKSKDFFQKLLMLGNSESLDYYAYFIYSCLNDICGIEQPKSQARVAAFLGLLVSCKHIFGYNWMWSFILAYLPILCTGTYVHLYLVLRTLLRDLRGLSRLMRMKMFIRRCRKHNYTVGDLFQKLVKKHPNKTCFMHLEAKWTYKEVENYSNQIANCFSDLGFSRGDKIALFMEGRPEFICMWLGLSKIGVVTALINTNLRLQSLAHSISVVNCKAVVYGTELTNAVKDVAPMLSDLPNLQYFSVGKYNADFPSRPLDALIEESSAAKHPSQCKGNMNDHLFYVYTSGTTGMPKAAIIRHSRFMWLGTSIYHMSLLRSDDVIYTALPLYHTAGGILSTSQTLLFGLTLAIRTKFSASKFWEDCIKFQATASQYIGELCRYLLAQPVRPEETQHRVRLFVGNGLRPQYWSNFVQRFRVKHIREFYGSTEGNANVMNIDDKVGCVGFMSRIIPTIYPVSLIRVDPTSGEPVRDKKGLCMRCEPGEPGEFVGKIIVNDPLRSFDGYVNKSATEKKIVKDCFRKGDMAFLSGDLLTMDNDGYLFFMDRTGDTFRWRGENVSTLEVEGIVGNIVGLKDCVVYGVDVPDNEGKAGMVAIHDPSHKLDVNYLATEVTKALPSYAVPLFLRICSEMEATGTFKLKKVELQKEGFNKNLIQEPLYYYDKKLRTYVKLDSKTYENICSGNLRL